MTVEEWLKTATNRLEDAEIGTAQLDSLVLLEAETAKDRSWLLAYPEFELPISNLVRLNKKIARRAKHEPLAYIRGFTEFYGRKFKINKRVLEPRPESEAMIDILKELVERHPRPRIAVRGRPDQGSSGKIDSRLRGNDKFWCLADVGTGSGALGITAALELHNHQVDLYDIDAGALAVAKHNSLLHELHLHVRKSDLLSQRWRDYDLVLANLPYVPKSWRINASAALEPKIAIFGGPDGLNVYRRLFEQLKRLKTPPKWVLTEAMPIQHPQLAEIASSSGYQQHKSHDFIQLFRLT